MSRYITDGVTTINFPTGTVWVDEFTYTPVVQSAERSIGGALIIDIQTRTGGQPITLQSSDESGWIRKSEVDRLTLWSRDPNVELTCVWDAHTWDVSFRHFDAPAFDPKPVTDFDDPDATDPYTFVLRLVEVTP